MKQTTGYQLATKIALVMIVKGTADEADHLERCLANINGYVDGIFLNINHKHGSKIHQKLLRTAQKYTNNIITTVWHDDFAEARNASLDMVPKEYQWILWLDSDDTIKNPEKIRKVAEVSTNYDAIYVDYLYDRDEANNPTTVHMVARLFQNNGSHRWKGRIHETLVETRSARQGMTKDFIVIHHAEEARTQRSFQRNIKLLEMQLEDESKDPDPRTFYYLASTYMDAGDLNSALSLFDDYLLLSGWDQERAVALTKQGRIYLHQGNRAEAKKRFAWAVAENPSDPEPRVELGSMEIQVGNYQKARDWLEPVEKMQTDGTTLERNPMTATFRTYLLLGECYINIGGKELEKGLEYAKKALKYKSRDKKIKDYVKVAEQVVRDKHLTENVVVLYSQLHKNKEEEKKALLLQAVPKQLEDNPLVVKLRDKDPRQWPAKSIAIMTGDTALDAWGPWSLKEGIGGSEEAIIRLSKHLKDLGYKVVVFAKPGHQAGLYDGIMWRNYWECNLNDEFDIFVAWRAPFIFDKKIKARKSYLWMHDVMEPGEFTPERIANFTKCILLSKYHRSLFPMIPDEKVLMSGNGIDPEDFYRPDEGLINYDLQRDPHKILYASSHVRGLAYLYKIWPEVKQAVPDATLDVYYGRESYDKVHRGNPERMKWMDDMINKAKELEGVIDHGKVSQDKIMEAGFRSGLWAYPCPFPEIYCITAIKSQASGAVPVASNYAALNETIQFGYKQSLGEYDDADLAKYKDALIWWLKHPEEQEKIRPKMMAWARTQSWERVALAWSSEFEL